MGHYQIVRIKRPDHFIGFADGVLQG